jgi:hypothetical protein
MRILRAALLVAMLLGCDDDGNQPTAPVQSASSGGTAAAGEAALATESGGSRGFYVDGFPNGGSSISIGTDFTEIQKYSGLPTGNYLATASAVLASSGADLHFVDCIFTINGTIRGELGRGTVGGFLGDNFLSLPLTIGFTVKSPADVGVACRTDVAGVVFTQASPITAIRVDRLTTQHP